jgi:hypothetical protein
MLQLFVRAGSASGNIIAADTALCCLLMLLALNAAAIDAPATILTSWNTGATRRHRLQDGWCSCATACQCKKA